MIVEYLVERDRTSNVAFSMIAGDVKIRIEPGINDIPDAHWDLIKDDAAILERIEREVLKVHDPEPVAPKTRKGGKDELPS